MKEKGDDSGSEASCTPACAPQGDTSAEGNTKENATEGPAALAIGGPAESAAGQSSIWERIRAGRYGKLAARSVYSSFIGRTGALIWATFKRDIPRVIGPRKCYESMPLAARHPEFKDFVVSVLPPCSAHTDLVRWLERVDL